LGCLVTLSGALQACQEELWLEWEYELTVCRKEFLEKACGSNP